MQRTPAVNTVNPVSKVTSFPCDDFLSRAVHNLQRLAIQQHIKATPWPAAFDHRDLQRRHAPAQPQAPHAAA